MLGMVYLQRIFKMNELGILLVYILMCAIISFVNPSFLSFDNLINIVRTSSYVVIAGVTATMIFIVGGLDLSVGSVIGLGGLSSALVLVHTGLPVWVAICAGLLVGLIFGLFNGIASVKWKIPSLIVTLGTLYIARGLMNVITEGRPVYPLPDAFNNLGSGTIFKLPYSVFIAVILVFIVYFVLKYTIYGRNIYAIGGNEETARLSGINVDRIRISVYALASMTAALTGIIMTARMASAQVSTGTGWELTVISAVIIGGTSMFGGVGTVFGTVLGALVMTTLSNGLVLMRVSAFWQNVFIGVIIILAVGIDQLKRRKSGDAV
jgi:ribose/xylose/arabinose/galactoside ABC-type transport system permease subunit